MIGKRIQNIHVEKYFCNIGIFLNKYSSNKYEFVFLPYILYKLLVWQL